MKARIIGTGSFVPEKVMTNHDLSRMVDTNDQWIKERTGIHERRIAECTAVDMASEAAEAALVNSGTMPKDINLIIAATSTGDHFFPNTACEIQKRIGAVNAACFDISAACSGFLFALSTADAYIRSGLADRILIVGVDMLSRIVDWNDRSTCILFGDGAGAVVVAASETGMESQIMGSDGRGGDVLRCGITYDQERQYMYMEGQEVFRFAVRIVPESIHAVLAQAGAGADEIKYFVLHQANRRIIEAAAKRMKVEIERFPMNLADYGNTSAASIPILLDEMNRKGMLEQGDKLVLAGFGAGLTWGAALVVW